MSVYVDTCVPGLLQLYGRDTLWCHMIADTLEELHVMADRIGMKRSWFQAKASTPHYDLVPSRRARAVALGAVECDRATFVAAIRRLRAERVR